ncbi:DUF551 domain-containing protein [Klebsiella electrica]|uniref:DUF551 domain-containing protein n=1 Tax=Klebsiella electrica TaxID=1259973 RepID=A0AAJ5QZG9_9ENTR|nr:DUF551 domain-containing protein [Klebsiella electrica]WBW63300.1 DUF551 domain-containing protein [Klebsiella electrica]
MKTIEPIPTLALDDLLSIAASAIEDLLEHTDPNTSYYSGVWADVPGKLRAAMLQAGNSPVIPEGWQVEAEKLAEMHGMSFVLFRHGEAPQCADPTKVVISFTDKGLGHDTEPQNAQQNIPEIIPGWIPVSERLPDKNQSVLISVNFDSSLVDPLICTARYTGSTFRRGEATVKPGSGIEEVTHWMPLPAAPQEVK